MTHVATQSPQRSSPEPPPAVVGVSPWLGAVAIVPILLTVYQTLVLTDVVNDVISKGITAEHYSMIWTDVCFGVSITYGLFAGIWAMARYGGRDTLLVGLVWFALGNLLCGAATDVATLAAAKLVEGVGKGIVIAICRSLLYRQFANIVIVAIGFYGVIAYATRPTTPLLTALVNDALSWRWVFWMNVPLALVGLPLVLRFIKPDRPPRPLPLRIDWISVTLFAAWVVSLVFVFGWYRRWGGWSSNAFTATALLALVLPVALAAWIGSGMTASEHLRRMFRVRVYVLAMSVRMLMLLQLLAALSLIANYCVGLRGYPREVAGWILAPATLTMTASTLLTIRYRRRALRHFWLLIGVLGCAASLWWMSTVDNFTSKEQVAWMIGCWGLFLGLFAPAFLQDEVEGLDRRDSLYGGALAALFFVVPMVVVPSMTSTIVSAWTDRALDAERLNLRRNSPEVEQSSGKVAEYYQKRGVGAPESYQMASGVLGGLVKVDATARGIQTGLRFLSLIVGGIGLLLSILLISYPIARSG